MKENKPFQFIKDPRSGQNYSLQSQEGIRLIIKYLSQNTQKKSNSQSKKSLYD